VKRVGDVADADPAAVHKDPDDVEPVALPRAAMAPDPDCRRPAEFALLAPVDCLHRVSEVGTVACFDLDESDQTATFDDEVNVTVAGAVASLQDAPT
jgi:hypothetical protein